MIKPRLLVAVARYHDTDKKYGLGFTRPRNRFYVAQGFETSVLDFSADCDSTLEGVEVITYKTYLQRAGQYDVLIMHAPNIRNHYRFLTKHILEFKRVVLFIHGHEMMRVKYGYAKPFPFVKQKGVRARIESLIRDPYDLVKLRIWRKYFEKDHSKLHFVFVSNWMREEFLKWVGVSPSILDGRESIIPNCIGEVFETERYVPTETPKFDFITIRGNIDGSKYAVDLVNEFATRNPDKRFLVVGKGELFKHIPKANNLVHRNEYLSHAEMIDALNDARCALMPTRTDAQGVAMCEMATFGIPLVTSDIPVCHESLDGFGNVGFIANTAEAGFELASIADSLSPAKSDINERFYLRNTAQRELDLFVRLFREAEGYEFYGEQD